MFNNKLEYSHKDDGCLILKEKCIERINKLADDKEEKKLKVIYEFINGYSE